MTTNLPADHPAKTGEACFTCGRSFLATAAAIFNGSGWVHPGCWFSPNEVRTFILDTALELSSTMNVCAKQLHDLALELQTHGWTGKGQEVENIQHRVERHHIGAGAPAGRLLRALTVNLPDVG